jgi:hypothetical protein
MISAFDPLKDAAADFVNAFGPSGSDFAQWITVGLFFTGFAALGFFYWLGRRLEGRKYELKRPGLLCWEHAWHAESGPCPYCLNEAAEREARVAIGAAFHEGSSSRGV